MNISSLFIGKTPSDALVVIPSLFSVCGVAQACAATQAIEQALSINQPSSTQAARHLVVWAETAREHLVRITMDWGVDLQSSSIKIIMPLAQNIKSAMTGLFELAEEVDLDVSAIKVQIALLENYLEVEIFGEPISTWRDRLDVATMRGWMQTGATPVAARLGFGLAQGWQYLGSTCNFHSLPNLDVGDLLDRFTEPNFIAQPTWNGQACETTAMTRQRANPMIEDFVTKHGAGLLTRQVAFLAELAAIPLKLRGLLARSQEKPIARRTGANSGVGVAQVEAARGRLVHVVRVNDGRIADYKILAPTEWNFHPQGVAARALETLDAAADDQLMEQAHMLIRTIDPCVAYDLRIG